jgi:hypothetical protein
LLAHPWYAVHHSRTVSIGLLQVFA